MVNDTVQYLEAKGIVVARVLSGHFMTALEMAGASITLLKHDVDSPDMLELLDAPAFAPAWKSIQCSDGTAAMTAKAPHESLAVAPPPHQPDLSAATATTTTTTTTTTDVRSLGMPTHVPLSGLLKLTFLVILM